MKATGIVRRIDELGRVVIPKELRRTLRIKEGDELEIYTKENNELVMRRFSAINNLEESAIDYAQAIYNSVGQNVLVTDTNEVLGAAGSQRNFYGGKRLSQSFIKTILERATLYCDENQVKRNITADDSLQYQSQLIMPVVAGGDVYGAVVLLSQMPQISDTDKAVVASALEFLRLKLI